MTQVCIVIIDCTDCNVPRHGKYVPLRYGIRGSREKVFDMLQSTQFLSGFVEQIVLDFTAEEQDWRCFSAALQLASKVKVLSEL